MTRTDFEFYALEYLGTVIPDKKSFNSAEIEAAAFVDAIITNKEYLNIGDNPIRYHCAVCSVAEEIYRQTVSDETPQKQSESVGNHSVSYSVSSKSYEEREKIKHNKARLYLSGTGLLYRGMS